MDLLKIHIFTDTTGSAFPRRRMKREGNTCPHGAGPCVRHQHQIHGKGLTSILLVFSRLLRWAGRVPEQGVKGAFYC